MERKHPSKGESLAEEEEAQKNEHNSRTSILDSLSDNNLQPVDWWHFTNLKGARSILVIIVFFTWIKITAREYLKYTLHTMDIDNWRANY